MRSLTAILLFAVVVPLHAQTLAPSTGDPLLDQFMAASDMENCIMLGGGQIEALIEQEREQMDEASFALFAGAMRHAFAPEAMRGDGVAVLRRLMDADTARAVIEWLESPLGRRLVDMESAASEASDEAVEAYGQSLDPQDAVVRDRVLVVLRLHESMNIVERTVDLIVGMMEAMLSAVNEVAPAEQRMGEEQVRELVDGMRAQFSESMPGYLVLQSLHTYQQASTEELAAYADFMASPEGRWYARVTVEASAASMSNVGTRLGEAMAAKFTH